MPLSSVESRSLPRGVLLLAMVMGIVSQARGAGPADPLFKLVPPDAALTLALEDLRGHALQAIGSPILDGLRGLPGVRQWLRSDESKGLQRAVGRIEKVLATGHATLRDDLLGEAVVLTLRFPPGSRPEEARGLLLLRVPDLELLDRVIQAANASQSRNGELVGVTQRSLGQVPYHRREFRQGGRPDEFYVKLPDRVFAWSNSETLIREVIERQGRGGPGLADQPTFREAHAKLPERALIRLYVDPRSVEQVLAIAPPPEKPEDLRLLASLERYLSGVRHIAAAFCWDGAPVLHVEERFDPENVAPALRRWASRESASNPALLRVPSSAIALASAHLDVNALIDGVIALSGGEDLGKLETLWTAGRGLALGLDLREQVFPNLGPWASAYVETPPDLDRRSEAPGDLTNLPMVISWQIARTAEGQRAFAALDNALRTFLALSALDPKNAGAGLQLETPVDGGPTITSIRGGVAFSYAMAEGRVVLGTSPGAVARALAAQSDPRASERFEALRARGFPEASSFACVDLRAVHAFANPRRDVLARLLSRRQNRPEPDARGDLDEALAVIELFEAVAITSTVAPDFSRAHRTLGLIPRTP